MFHEINIFIHISICSDDVGVNKQMTTPQKNKQKKHKGFTLLPLGAKKPKEYIELCGY